MEPVIRIKGVTRSFPLADGKSAEVLKGLDMEIFPGSLVILKGRSGSGKTTLLNILGALDYPTSGEVYLNGTDIARMNEAQRSRIRRTSIGFVFQSVALIPILSAYENVEFSLRLAKSVKQASERKKKAMEALRMVGLEARMDHMPQELSGGEQQRVAIARATVHQPGVLFADEPTAQLDTATGLQVVKIFQKLTHSQGITVVMTTHDSGLMELGDQVFELEDGVFLHGS